ncbi:small ribosomal subunit Rsm22 family protein [Streptomyces sp. TRM 70351]|uniref:small ribosomal subunit Rsm22 family protein n=1 Tax=Streptomyces sp. TRM 70351 TaxID=3116552 RepID=UPI002E7B816D|nr:small ribosomal subunit Rsm22 family protein [Streptomyces sp. TRM 70351]MEE1928585.1 small ribosomal subunit Rsm22 family protein [Streptomyces sp. TRM 70351]
MHDERLRAALDGLLDGLPPKQAAAAVERLIASYRGATPTHTPVLRDRADAAAYAAYRMPATHGAVSAALAALAARLPGWSPATHTDLGGGTGAATWAVAGTWPGECASTVVDWAGPALALGRELAGGVLPDVTWHQARLGGPGVPDADLVTVSYVLGELTEPDRDAVVDAAARGGRAVVVVEPGTPDGYLRVRAARDRLLAAGLRVLAPCPHGATCPITPGTDWCHFAARVSRSSLHRRVKGGTLPYEDEKYSYVAAVRDPDAAPGGPAARVVRRPQIRKGQVLLDLCTASGELARTTVTKRDRDAYRAARDTQWGDPWPPVP